MMNVLEHIVSFVLPIVTYAVGHRRGSRASREKRRQQALESAVLGESPNDSLPTVERAVVRDALIETTHRWDQDNNGDR